MLLYSSAFRAESACSRGVIQSVGLRFLVQLHPQGLPYHRAGVGAQEGNQAEGSVMLSHGLIHADRITRCYQLPRGSCYIKSLGWLHKSFAHLFVLLLWEGVKKAVGLGSGPLSRLGRAEVL